MWSSNFVNHSYDYRPNMNPLSPITIIYIQPAIQKYSSLLKLKQHIKQIRIDFE